MRQRSRSRWATPCAFFDGSGYANGNFEDLSTTSSKYSFLASDVFGNFCKSTSSTSNGSRNLDGSIANCCLRDRFLRPHPHNRTYSRASLHMPGQWNRSRNNANVLTTPGCPCWQCIRASRSDTRQLGIANTDVRLTNVALRSISSHRRLRSSIRYPLKLPSSNHSPPLFPLGRATLA